MWLQEESLDVESIIKECPKIVSNNLRTKYAFLKIKFVKINCIKIMGKGKNKIHKKLIKYLLLGKSR